ncbi:BLOC-2 complex member HPS5-like isoform X1 [Montipora capricornis]|uniref:BLOC-2 complex member HPS5-like isoform X1 n=2 Tax=Montipora capricornis TaxID=246305 RepID=UPI0035F1E128
MAAELGAQEVRWSGWTSIAGEYGVLLTEMGSMEELNNPIKSYPRIKYTCMTASKRYVAMGSSTGGIYIFHRQTLKHSRFLSSKDGPIHVVTFTQYRSLLAAATSQGIVHVWEVSSRGRGKPKLIRRSEEHKNTTVTALVWDSDEGRVFAGDIMGVVSVIHVPLPSKLSPSVNKSRPLLHTSSIVAKAQTAIVQLDCVGDKLLVSTMTKCAIVDLKSLDSVPVGVKLREGLYGSCFFKESMSDNLAIYSARPGSRLWEASIDGQVLSTQQYKKLLATPPVTILGYRHSATKPLLEGDFPPQSVNFAKLLLVRERFIVTWYGMSLYIMDPILGQLVAWYSLDAEVQDICCVGSEIYVYDSEGCVKWFGLLSVKECVARLHKMGEVKQCVMVLLDCRHYIIPGSARDLVPVCLVANLRDRLREEENRDYQELILGLDTLEHDMEPETEESSYPPSFHGDLSMTSSPDTLSVCSDALTDDLEGTGSASGKQIGDGDRDDESNMSERSSLSRGTKKKDLSLEGMLMTAAAAAKKFTTERQKGNNNVRRSVSADSPQNGRNVTEKDGMASPSEQHQGVMSYGVGSGFVDNVGQQTEGVDIQERNQEAKSPLLGKKALERSPCHSDDSESRLSGNEAGVAEEEASEKKEKTIFKDKKKRKKRVVTVDIDSPQVKQVIFQESPMLQERSSPFRFPSLSTEDTELKSRRLSEPVSPVPSELSPGIPAILSKAKGLLKKKLKSPSDDHLPAMSPSFSPTPPLEESPAETVEEESQEIECPQEVEELIESSAKARNEVKNPAILFSIRSLCETLEGWISNLHSASKSCYELNANSEDSNNEVTLKSFLNAPAFDNVSYLARMCFDCGVYGLDGLKCLEYACNRVENMHRNSSNIVIQANTEIENVKDSTHGGLGEVTPSVIVSIPHDEITNCVATPLPIGIEGFMESSNIQQPSTGANAFTANTDSPISCSTGSGIEKGLSNLNRLVDDRKESASTTPLCDIDRDNSHPPDSLTQSSASYIIPSQDETTENSGAQAQSTTGRWQSLANCERICQHCANGTAFRELSNEMLDDDEESTLQKDDSSRCRFVSYYFFLLDVKHLRRTLFLSKGDRRKIWSILMDCLSGLVFTDNVIAKYITEGDARRALHELYDGMDAYSDTLLYHLSCLFEQDSRGTMLTCARMFPDVKPWEVMEICRQSKASSLESSSAEFVYYVEQLMRWRAEVGNTKEQTVGKVCEDPEVAIWWFHCALIADSAASREKLSCELCGKPRPGSHTVAWPNADHLQLLVDYTCEKDHKGFRQFMDLCWKHCYWSGLIRLCVCSNRRKEALRLLVCLSDLKLIKDPQSWGLLPKALKEWRLLLELLLSREHHGEESPHVCVPMASPDWSPDLTWNNVIKLMLERLGAGHTVNLLQSLTLDTPELSRDLRYACLLGAVIERRQRTLIHEMLKKMDSYLWSNRRGALSPKLNNFRKEEELLGSKSKDDIKPQLDSLLQFRTLEDGASNWGQNIRLSGGECLVCSLKLCEQISTSNQGLLMFECGHVFHKHCVPEAACVLCFQENLTSIGSCIL